MNNAAILSLWLGNAALAAGLGYWFGHTFQSASKSNRAAQGPEIEDAESVLEELEAEIAWSNEDCSRATVDLDAIASQACDSAYVNPEFLESVDRLIKSGRTFERRLGRSQARVSRLANAVDGLGARLASSIAEHRRFVGHQCSILERDVAAHTPELPLSMHVLLVTIRGFADRNRVLREELNYVKQQLAERESLLIRAQRDARIDSLTHLSNRRAFEEQLTVCHSRAEVQQETYSLVLFDLDRFKQINDRFGHPFGDSILAVFGRILAEAIRTSDLAARYGGEEFVILLPGADAAAANAVAERCRRQAEKSVVRSGDISQSFTVSGGVAGWADGLTAAEVLEAADEALYLAKSEGRNRIHQAAPRLNAYRNELLAASPG